MSETLKERLDNLALFLSEVANDKFYDNDSDLKAMANYHIATMDLLKLKEVSNE